MEERYKSPLREDKKKQNMLRIAPTTTQRKHAPGIEDCRLK
jgi:hypothetical protein